MVRLLVGFAWGLGLFAFGSSVARKGQTVFGARPRGRGLCHSLHHALRRHAVFGILPSTLAFVAALGITVAGIAIALREQAQVIAMLALVGGFLAPLLVDAEGPALRTQLYVVSLAGLGLWLSAHRNWIWLDGDRAPRSPDLLAKRRDARSLSERGRGSTW